MLTLIMKNKTKNTIYVYIVQEPHMFFYNHLELNYK